VQTEPRFLQLLSSSGDFSIIIGRSSHFSFLTPDSKPSAPASSHFSIPVRRLTAKPILAFQLFTYFQHTEMASSEDDSSAPATDPPTPVSKEDLQITSSLADLQTDEQRRVLDTVTQVRKCGLDRLLELPQLVVCGDQSAGKSSVLEGMFFSSGF
jgi:hypothetical protein